MYNGTIRNCVFQNNSCNYDAKFSISGVLNANDFYCYLENNVFEHPIIVNTGKILSVTDLVILDNETVDCAVGDIVNITATLKLSNQPIADIHSSNLKFIIDSVEYAAKYANGKYYYEYNVTKADLISVSAVCSNVPYGLVHTGALYAKLASNITLENISDIKYGESITLVANLAYKAPV